MRAAEPHLLDPARRMGIVPQQRRKGRAGLVQGQGLEPVLDPLPQMGVVEPEPRFGQHPQHRQAQAQGHDRVETADHADRRLRVTAPAPEGGHRLRRAPLMVIAPSQPDMAFGRRLRLQQAHAADHPRQAADREGPAGIAQHEDPVAGAITAGQPAIGVGDAGFQDAAHHQVGQRAPARPLLAHAVMDADAAGRHGAQLTRQQAVDAADGTAPPVGQRREGAVHQHDMGGGWSNRYHAPKASMGA